MALYHILLADDEQIERMALARRLKRHFGDSCVITEAVNGAEAVELFQRELVQIVIMDIAMPEMNGVEAAEQIRKLDEDCVIIFLTAYDEFTYARRAIIIRALDYLLKPCEEEELMAVMEEAMRLTDRRTERVRQEQECTEPALRDKGDDTESLVNLGGDTDVPNVPKEFSASSNYEDTGADRMSQVASAMKEYIRSNYMNEISMQDAAREMKYSDAYFCKLFKQCFDQNFTTYLAKFRMNEAKKLLMNRNINVKDVGVRVGYYDSNYFAKVFKRMTGMIPSEYRENQKV